MGKVGSSKIMKSAYTSQGYDLGLITDVEVYTNKGAYKRYHNNAWNHMKMKAEEHSKNIFISLNNKTKSSEIEAGDDW